MRKLTALCRAIEEATRLPRSGFDAWAELGTLELSGRNLGAGVEICRFQYNGVLWVRRYPGDGSDLLALVAAWLRDNDPERDDLGLDDPDVNVELNDPFSADVDISIRFEEPVEITPDPRGNIPWGGRLWRVADAGVDVAERLDALHGDLAGGR